MPVLDRDIINILHTQAKNIRTSIITMLAEAGSGHTAGALGMADIFTVLFFSGLMKHDPKKPSWMDRDRLVLSNGHICPVYYATLAHAGYFPVEELKTLRKFGARLQGHPHREFFPFTETSSGPLGEGLSQTVGMALAERIDNENSQKKIFCLMSDGELQEGQSWEAAMLAGKEKLHNLIAIVDFNNIQISGNVSDVMPLEPLADKWRAWNWNVINIDGNDFFAIAEAVKKAKDHTGAPTVILARTVPGKGVQEWEGKFEWHGKPPTKEEAKKALEVLK
ncbi:MAG: transketolase [Candidatus Paceibacterota bacterium]|jgi:transketolase